MNIQNVIDALKPLEGHWVGIAADIDKLSPVYFVKTVRRLPRNERASWNRDNNLILDSGEDVIIECDYKPQGPAFDSKRITAILDTGQGGVTICYIRKNGSYGDLSVRIVDAEVNDEKN